MWILTPSITSAFAAATGASISASSEQLASACAQSLLWRSSASPSATWQRRLKQNSWTAHLSGAICEPSLGESFTDWWTSSLAATRASHSAPPANASALKTPDTSGRLSQPELLQCDQVSVFLRTSRDISALGFPTCCKTWQEWVTERRGAWRARVNAARLTKERGSLFWPSVVASEVRQGFQDRSRGMKGSQESLTTAVILHGQAAPASGNSLGSRQGLWQTPKASNADCPVIHNPQRSDGGQPNLAAQMVLEQQRQALWLTPRANEPTGDSTFVTRNGDRGQHCSPSLTIQVEKTPQWMTPRACEAQNPPMGVDKRHHGLTHQVTKQWATPRSGKTTDQNPETWALRQAKGDVATMPLGAQVKCWGTPAANDANKQNVMCEVNSKQAGLPKSVGLELQRQWGTPTARDHKSGRGNEERQYKESTPMVERQQSGKLNPRWVETLMGLPIGWTMPSCMFPQTIAPTSCDSSAMESACPPLSVLGEFSLASWPSPRLNENQQTEELGLLWAENGFKQPKTRGGKARANGSTFDVTLETAARGVAAMEATT